MHHTAKNQWQTKKLGEVCDFLNGLWKGKEPPYAQVGVIRNTNFTKNGELDDSDIAYLDVEKKKFEKRKLVYGDIIVEKSGGGPKQPVGRVITFDKKDGQFSFSNFTSVIRVKNAEQINFKYLHKYLFFFYMAGFTEAMQSHSTGIRNLNFNKYKEIDIPLPPLSEQKRIVSILGESFQAIEKAKENTEKNLINSRALFDNYLQTIFSQRGEGWAEKELSELCDIRHGFAFKSQFFTKTGNHVLLTPGNFYESGGYRDRGDKQKYYSGEIPAGFILEKDDLLVAMTEQAAGLLGSPILVPESKKFLHNQRLGLVIKKPNVPWLNEFFFYVFNTQNVRKVIHGSASGVKVRHTSPKKIGKVIVSFPTSLTKQREIVSTLETLTVESRNLISIYQEKLAALQELKQSLLTKAFAGKL